LGEARLYCDGASKGNPGEAGCAFVIEAEGLSVECFFPIGVATNNVAEYLALLLGLEECLRRGFRRVRAFSDSELLVKQLRGEYGVRSPVLKRLHGEVLALASAFELFSLEHVRREENALTDELANRAVRIQRRVKSFLDISSLG